MSQSQHHWVQAAYRSERARLTGTLSLPDSLLPTVDAHRQLRGPYTAASTLLEGLVPEMQRRAPDLVRSHDIEILSAAPDLHDMVPATRKTLTSLAIPAERTRFYSPLRTLRIANGLAELLRDYLTGVAEGPRSLVVENAHVTDRTDAEWLAVLLRRIDPGLLTVVVCTAAKPEWEVLSDVLAARCAPTMGRAEPAVSRAADFDVERLAEEFVAGDCVGDDPMLVDAYERADTALRPRLHDRRAQELEASGRKSLWAGAIPYHLERGSAPDEAGAAALLRGMEYCINMGYYHANIDLGYRGRSVSNAPERRDSWVVFSVKMVTALGSLGRTEEAEAVNEEVRSRTTNPDFHKQAAYAAALLYTRHLAVGKRDHLRAKAQMNEAIAIATLGQDPTRRSMETVFYENGLALIEVHLKNLPEALRLVTEGIERLDRELRPDQHRLHRSVLRYNRAQVLAGMGRLDEALADYEAVIEVDPNYAEYHLDRGNILRRLGRDAEALTEYEIAIRLSPPFPEVYYNRADVLLAAGDVEAGMAGLDYVIELEPTFVDAYVNRAGLRVELGDLAGAADDVTAGLELEPGNAHLHCVRGQLLAEQGHTAEAVAAYDTALGYDETLRQAWACRGAAVFDPADPSTAIEDLSRALELSDDAAVRYNRATAYRAMGRDAEALTDLRQAAVLAPDDTDVATLLSELDAA